MNTEEPKAISLAGILPAGILAILTLFVFTTLRNFGPASTVRRFHLALEEGKFDELPQYWSGSLRSEGSVELLTFVANQIRMGSDYRIEQREQREGAVFVYVTYGRGRMRAPMLWVVERSTQDGKWRINADRTYYLLRSAFAR